MVEEQDGPARRVSSRIASKPPKETAGVEKRKSVETSQAVKKAKTKVKGSDDGSAVPALEGTATAEEAPAPSSGSKALGVGDSLPKVTLKDQSGKDVDASQLKKTVLFTYPKANTPGCTTQALSFRDQYSEFQKAGFQVYGLSSDSEASLKSWKEKRGFEYSLLSDPKRALIGSLTGSSSSTIRSHFVVDVDGKLAHSAIKVKPAESCPAALQVAKGL